MTVFCIDSAQYQNKGARKVLDLIDKLAAAYKINKSDGHEVQRVALSEKDFKTIMSSVNQALTSIKRDKVSPATFSYAGIMLNRNTA